MDYDTAVLRDTVGYLHIIREACEWYYIYIASRRKGKKRKNSVGSVFRFRVRLRTKSLGNRIFFSNSKFLCGEQSSKYLQLHILWWGGCHYDHDELTQWQGVG